MTISSLIQTATSGLRASQAGLDVVSQNVANAGTVGYTRRVSVTQELISGTQPTGVAVLGANRVLDGILQKQLRLESAGAGYTGAKANALADLERAFDPSGGTGSLADLANGFTSAISSLANDPGNYSTRSSAVTAAVNLASSLNSLSDSVQTARQNAEDRIDAAVTDVNGILDGITAAGAAFRANVGSGSNPALLDQRDALIDRLSTYLDVKVTPGADGAVSISTTGGLLLFDGVNPTTLSFDRHAPLSTDLAYSTDPTKRGVGSITATDALGKSRDVLALGQIRSGSIAAYVELRDDVLPQAQAQLDSLAAGLAAALSDKDVAGTAVPAVAPSTASGFSFDLSQLANGNSLTVSTKVGATARTVTFVKAGSAAAAAAATSPDGSRIGIDFSGGAASVATKIGTALGTNFAASASGTTLQILDDGTGTASVTGVSGHVSVAGLTTGDPELPLFVDQGGGPYTGSFENGTQLSGFSARITVNGGVVADPSTLVRYSSTTLSGDPTRPTLLVGRLNGPITIPGTTGLNGNVPVSGSLGSLANRIVAAQAAGANDAKNLDDGQKVVLNAVQSRFTDQSGVNIDNELTQLIQLQTAYGANARVLAAGKELLDTLLRIGA
ncbi:MAG: flagellar hook-associated protein FlgK [Methylobacteriaceae bacterium]|nr:flagellar hook-associated protein FlgK [Methylobacteriaceae bacterium]